MFDTTVVFSEKTELVTMGIDLHKASPGDKIMVFVDGVKVGEITDGQTDGHIDIEAGSQVNLKPISGEGSYFSYFENFSPPGKVNSDVLVHAYFKAN